MKKQELKQLIKKNNFKRVIFQEDRLHKINNFSFIDDKKEKYCMPRVTKQNIYSVVGYNGDFLIEKRKINDYTTEYIYNLEVEKWKKKQKI